MGRASIPNAHVQARAAGSGRQTAGGEANLLDATVATLDQLPFVAGPAGAGTTKRNRNTRLPADRLERCITLGARPEGQLCG